MSFKFGLTVKNKAIGGANKPVKSKKKPILGDDDEDDANGTAKAIDGAEEIAEFNFDETTASKSTSPKPDPTKKRKGQPTGPPTRPLQAKQEELSDLANSASVKEAQKKAEEATALDPTIFDYDAAYDALHARTAAKKAAQEQEALEGRPKYFETLLESAEVRKMDRLRARDKLLQREREAEGDEFADKAKFVTGAYKAHQEEARKAEKEEKRKQEEEEKRRRDKGMQGFHRNMLRDEGKRHREAQLAMDKAAEMAKEGTLPISTEEESKEKRDAEIAEGLKAKGKKVIINDEGEVVDKRQLLTAGLNVAAKPKSATTGARTSARPTRYQTGYQERSTGGRGARERQSAMIAQQIGQAAKRKADEEAEEQQKLEHASKSRKTESDISSAKERYLQRKREAAAAKAAASK